LLCGFVVFWGIRTDCGCLGLASEDAKEKRQSPCNRAEGGEEGKRTRSAGRGFRGEGLKSEDGRCQHGPCSRMLELPKKKQ